MTGFVGAALTQIILLSDDTRACDEQWLGNEDLFVPPVLWDTQWEDDKEYAGWQTPWWPAGSSVCFGSGGLQVDCPIAQAGWWGEPWISSGANGRLAFVGITRDATGSALANCTVRCIRTGTDEMVSKVTSDANGFYIATSPYTDAHFLVIHNAAGDRAGASVNTILPA